jgi:cytochrome c oxidase subunit 4
MSHEHIDPVSDYVKTFVWLLVLLVITVGAAMFPIEALPFANIIIAMLIATIKAVLVVTIFMGMRKTTKLTQVWAYGGIIFFLTLIFISLSDYFVRPLKPPTNTEQPVAMSAHREGPTAGQFHISRKF